MTVYDHPPSRYHTLWSSVFLATAVGLVYSVAYDSMCKRSAVLWLVAAAHWAPQHELLSRGGRPS